MQRPDWLGLNEYPFRPRCLPMPHGDMHYVDHQGSTPHDDRNPQYRATCKFDQTQSLEFTDGAWQENAAYQH